MSPFRAAPLLLLGPLAAHAQPVNPIPFPHPMIAEVLFDVPDGADPNQDGVRHPVGDEFVELINPHDRPIDITGYAICDRRGGTSAADASGIRFYFPHCILQPGQIVLVFNGYLANIPGPLGTREAAPSGPNDRFGGALVFTMNNTSGSRAFSNTSDVCALVSPEGRAIDLVIWGKNEPVPPENTFRFQRMGSHSGSSVQRLSNNDRLVPHKEIDGKIMSPGRIPKPDPKNAAPPK